MMRVGPRPRRNVGLHCNFSCQWEVEMLSVCVCRVLALLWEVKKYVTRMRVH